MGEVPSASDTEFWEPKAQVLLKLLDYRGPLSIRAIKAAMTRRGFKVGITVNILAYCSLTERVKYNRDEKTWEACK